MNSVNNPSLSRSKLPCLWRSRFLLSFLLIKVAILWASCGNETFTPPRFKPFLFGLVKDKETLEPLNNVFVGIKRPATPDSVISDSSAFLTFTSDERYLPNFDLMESITESIEDGRLEALHFSIREDIINLVAWKAGYRLWKFDAQCDTIRQLDNGMFHINMYMEKLDN